MQILFITNIIKHTCQGIRSKETIDGLLKKWEEENQPNSFA
jgi:hypothetical protein